MPRLKNIEDFYVGQKVRSPDGDPANGVVAEVLENSVVIRWSDILHDTPYSTPIEENNDRIYPFE